MRPEQEFFEAIAYFTEAKTCVEIGVARGDTTICLSRSMAKNKGMVYCFDIWGRHGIARQYHSFGSKEKVEKRLAEEGCTNVVLTQIDTRIERDRFENLLDVLCPDGIDFAFIDGCHSYQGVANDFCCVYPRLTTAGIIAFHDTLIIDGCREFMLDLRTKYYDGTFDVINFYGGRQKNLRVGISILVKRSFPITDDAIVEMCGSPSEPAEIERKENSWYKKESGSKIPANTLIDNSLACVSHVSVSPCKEIVREKYELHRPCN